MLSTKIEESLMLRMTDQEIQRFTSDSMKGQSNLFLPDRILSCVETG